jgi:hypothetical protein
LKGSSGRPIKMMLGVDPTKDYKDKVAKVDLS